MKNTYIYPAIFYYDDDGISIEFPDLPGCCPCATMTDEAIKNAREALGVHLYGMEQDNDIIPEPSDPKDIEIEKGAVLMLVDVFMPVFREQMSNKVIKKTLTIPYWLNAKAESIGINFSQTLQEALKEKIQ